MIRIPDRQCVRMTIKESMKMKKRTIAVVALLTAGLTMLSGCGMRSNSEAAENVAKHLSKVPANWFDDTLNYYVYGVSTNWEDDELYGDLPEEMKDPANRFGYYLADLNDDGTKELFIGYVDDEPETRFLYLYYYHPDFGVKSWSGIEGYYLYLCDGNIIRNDWDYPGGKVQSDYMTMNKDVVDGWPIQEYESDPPKPLKLNLMPLDEVTDLLPDDITVPGGTQGE